MCNFLFTCLSSLLNSYFLDEEIISLSHIFGRKPTAQHRGSSQYVPVELDLMEWWRACLSCPPASHLSQSTSQDFCQACLSDLGSGHLLVSSGSEPLWAILAGQGHRSFLCGCFISPERVYTRSAKDQGHIFLFHLLYFLL